MVKKFLFLAILIMPIKSFSLSFPKDDDIAEFLMAKSALGFIVPTSIACFVVSRICQAKISQLEKKSKKYPIIINGQLMFVSFESDRNSTEKQRLKKIMFDGLKKNFLIIIKYSSLILAFELGLVSGVLILDKIMKKRLEEIYAVLIRQAGSIGEVQQGVREYGDYFQRVGTEIGDINTQLAQIRVNQ